MAASSLVKQIPIFQEAYNQYINTCYFIGSYKGTDLYIYRQGSPFLKVIVQSGNNFTDRQLYTSTSFDHFMSTRATWPPELNKELYYRIKEHEWGSIV